MSDEAPARNLSPEFVANAGKGRPKGSKNKFTMAVKEMILEALDKAGGVDYLAGQATENPAAFLTLVGKVLPMQVSGIDGEDINVVTTIRLVGVNPNDSQH